MGHVHSIIHGAFIGVVAFALIGGMCSLSSATHAMSSQEHMKSDAGSCIICPAALAPHIAFLHHELSFPFSFPQSLVLFPIIAFFFSINVFVPMCVGRRHLAYREDNPPPWLPYLNNCFSQGILNPKCA